MNTYQNPPVFGSDLAAPQRTSLAAIFALICGLLGLFACCIPFVGLGVGVIGLLLGVIGLVAISSSDGRIKGRGMALTGLITGLIATAVNVFVIVGLGIATTVLQAYPRVAEAAMARDHAMVVAAMSSDSAQAVTPESLAKFADEVEAAVGPGATFHSGLLDMYHGGKIMGTQAAGSQAQIKYAGYSVIPFHVRGSTRNAALLVVTNPREESGDYKAGKVLNLIVIPEGTQDAFYLVDPEAKPN